ncbi:MAG: helicase-related protein [Actinomycetota bacterium]|nr:helicase-related protein [Actinomycetota bacterium]
MTESAEHATGLRELGLGIGYDSGDAALRFFYIPALSRATSYDRSVGYFRASAIAAAARGVSRFIASGGKMRLLVGAELAEEDRAALVGATEIPPALAARLAAELVPADEIAAQRLAVLAWLATQGRLEVRVAVPVDPDGVPLPAEQARPYFHEKLGVLRDAAGDGVAFQGSVNESDTAWTHNFESFSVYKSWDGSAPYFDEWASRFERRWSGDVPGFRVFALPDPAVQALLALAPADPPPVRDPEEGPEAPPREILATFLRIAPRLVGASELALATTGVTVYPHQSKVVERLAGTYPRSWLVADEVGLGKTISAGLALRRLVLSGEVERALVLAPAAVCRQWQDELFEKFGLWVPRLEARRVWGAHPADVRELRSGENPYESEPLLLVSSHLARRPEHQNLILAAPPLDLLVVDEAHHARRRGADPSHYRPSRLLGLLDRIVGVGHARARWLLTATPMQVAPIELVDLLRHVGLSGPLADLDQFLRFYAELQRADADRPDWNYLGRSLPGAHEDLDDAELAVLARIEAELGPVAQERIRRFGQLDEPCAQTAEALGVAGRNELRRWLRQRGPVGRSVTRHTRRSLRHYRDIGLLTEPIADRDVKLVPIRFTPEEQELYESLDGVLDRLMQAHGTRRHAGFVLTVYRRRLTSSWAAISATLRRRIAGEQLRLDEDELDDADVGGVETLDAAEGTYVDDVQAVPLSPRELAELAGYVERLETVTDTKFERLRADIDAARGSGQAVIVFTAFVDTLNYLRDRLLPSYRSHLATYTGEGGKLWSPETGWQQVARTDLVDGLRSRRLSVILATDAAGEGLNLQAASYLINFDLPWNPMRVEQRIGRIDRIGQLQPTVVVRNYVIPGTIEEAVYSALSERIDIFIGLLGRLQPILGATEGAFSQIFRAPRSERAEVQSRALRTLVTMVEQLDRSGIDLDPDDDPLPDPPSAGPPVTLDELRTALVEDLGIDLDRPGRPVTFEPERVSRDQAQWCALGTYGHPVLEPALAAVAGPSLPGAHGSLVLAETGGIWTAYRGDRTPPSPVRCLADLADLGQATATGDAADRARREATSAAELRGERRRQGEARTREQWLASMRSRFALLTRQAVEATSALHAVRNDGSVDPHLVWLELTRDRASAWRNADSLRRHLGLELREILPAAPSSTNVRIDQDIEAVRATAARELNSLVKEWIARGDEPADLPGPRRSQ